MSWSWPARAMKPARSSATGRCRSPTTRRSGRRSRETEPMTTPPLWTRDGDARRHRAAALRAPSRPRDGRLDRHPHPGAGRPLLRHQGRGPRRPRLRRGGAREGRGGRRRRRGAGRGVRRGRPARRRAGRPRRDARGSGARRGRAAGARIVAVTGSVGKTGTKEALRLALSRHGATHASVASYNNHWGVPLTLARMPPRQRLRGLRDRHEPCRRDRAADRPRAAARRRRHRRSSRSTSSSSARSGASPTPRARSSPGWSPAARR